MKILQLLKKFRYRQLSQVDIVVFDNENSEIIKKAILFNLKYEVLFTREEVFYCSPKIIYFFSKNLCKKEFRELWSRCSNFDVLHLSYLYACLRCFNPKVVLTLIDNSYQFHWLSRNFKTANYYAIQNGVRIDYSADSFQQNLPEIFAKTSMPNFICFGEFERDLYTNCGHQIDKFHPVGSLFWSYFKNKISITPVKKEYDLCLVSEWDSDALNGHHLCFGFIDGLKNLDIFILKFLEQHQNTKLCIACRSSELAEYEYFQKTYSGYDISIIKNNRSEFSTYFAIEKSEVTIALMSTVAREAFGWGEKVVFCNFSGNPRYNLPINGIWSIVETDYKVFNNSIEEILRMNSSKYLEINQDERKYLMNYQSTPVHTYCRTLILNLLS